jgi:AcrR family transcriptional regulator
MGPTERAAAPRAAASKKSPAKRPARQAAPARAAPPRIPPEAEFDAGGVPASRRALRNQGRRTMRKLLDAAMVAFDRRGYHATRVNDVVEIAKTSHGTFYLYFSNKEDLLRALVAEAGAEVGSLYATMAGATAGGADWEDLRDWIGQYSALWTRYAPLLRAWTDLATIDPELGEQVRHTVDAMSGALAHQVSQSPSAHDVDPATAGLAVLAMLERFHYLSEFVGRPVDDAALDTLATIVHRALFAAER